MTCSEVQKLEHLFLFCTDFTTFIGPFGGGHEKDVDPSFYVMIDSCWKFPRLSLKCKTHILWTNSNSGTGFLHYVLDASAATWVWLSALRKGSTVESVSVTSTNLTLWRGEKLLYLLCFLIMLFFFTNILLKLFVRECILSHPEHIFMSLIRGWYDISISSFLLHYFYFF